MSLSAGGAPMPVARHIRDLLSRGDARGAVAVLTARVEQGAPDLHNEAVLLAGRIASIERNVRKGTTSEQDAIAARQQAALAMLELLDDIEARGLDLGTIAAEPPVAVKPAAATVPRAAGAEGETGPVARDQVFVSYCHADRAWLEKLRRMLVPLMRNRAIDLWEDSRIDPGDRWKTDIDEALRRARVAVLLVSPGFLASEFIHSSELPRILADAASHELTILWVYLSECLYEETPIGQYQAAHDVGRPLDALSEAEQGAVLKKVCLAIKAAAG